jgi:hypothetical protein
MDNVSLVANFGELPDSFVYDIENCPGMVFE